MAGKTENLQPEIVSPMEYADVFFLVSGYLYAQRSVSMIRPKGLKMKGWRVFAIRLCIGDAACLRVDVFERNAIACCGNTIRS